MKKIITIVLAVMLLFKKTIKRLRYEIFPTEHGKMMKKFFDDAGKDERLLFDYDLNQDSLVLDVGGYKGQWASDLFSRYQCHIIVFEPVKQFAEKIKERFARNEKIEVYPYGLGSSNRKEFMGICEDGSSIFHNYKITQEIELVDIVQWLDKQNIESIQLMKINIEGGEYELLERLIDSGLIKIIDNILVQFHRLSKELSSRTRMERIQKHLKETHRPIYQYRFVWESWTIKKKNNA